MYTTKKYSIPGLGDFSISNESGEDDYFVHGLGPTRVLRLDIENGFEEAEISLKSVVVADIRNEIRAYTKKIKELKKSREKLRGSKDISVFLEGK